MSIVQPTEKVCTRCKTSKPRDEFHAQADAKDGKSCHCKQCRHENTIAYGKSPSRIAKAKNRQIKYRAMRGTPEDQTRISESSSRRKSCIRCGSQKRLKEFVPDIRAKDGRSSVCKKCNNQRATALRKTPKGREARQAERIAYQATRRKPEVIARVKAATIARRNTPEGRQQAKDAYARQKAKPDFARKHTAWRIAWRASAEGGKKYKAALAAWRATPAGRASMYRSIAKRRAVKAGASIGDLDAIDTWEATWRYADSVCCFWCEKMFPGNECEADHVRPVSKGGAHCVTNLVISCEKCNAHKHNTLPELFNPARYAVWCSQRAKA